jgi:hypothetical protein
MLEAVRYFGLSPRYIVNWVWSGFYDRESVHRFLEDHLTADDDATALHALVDREFDRKAEAEETWTWPTDCDRLDAAFDALELQRVIALHCVGFSISALYEQVNALRASLVHPVKGFCFYDEQDVMAALEGSGLTISFGTFGDGPTDHASLGEIVTKALEEHGLTVPRDGNPDRRALMPSFEWKRRYSPYTQFFIPPERSREVERPVGETRRPPPVALGLYADARLGDG